MTPQYDFRALQPAPSAVDPTVMQVLQENPGLRSVYKPEDVAVSMASPERRKALQDVGQSDNQLEYWAPGEQGSPDFQRPEGHGGKHILEVYSDDLQKNPQALKDAIYGDLLHGMDVNPYWSALKRDFVSNYAPQTSKVNERLMKEGGNQKAIDDMYIRGRLAKNQGEEWNEPGRYSPKQLEILQKMHNYITKGDMR